MKLRKCWAMEGAGQACWERPLRSANVMWIEKMANRHD